MLNRTSEELGRDLRLYSALMFFKLGKLSSGAAAELAGVPRVLFLEMNSSESFRMAKPSLICDTSLLLYLGRVGQAALRPSFFEPLYVPEPVLLELAAGRLLRPDTINPQTLEWVVPVKVSTADLEALPPNRLGLGERSVLAYANIHLNSLQSSGFRLSSGLFEEAIRLGDEPG